MNKPIKGPGSSTNGPIQLIDRGSRIILDFLAEGAIRVTFKSISSEGHIEEDQETFNSFDEVVELVLRIQEEQDMEEMGMIQDWN